ncbi:RNA-binding protein 48 [Camellia lanceoleosa]|uniref:RNA-binding protein 48 n=1 Tax=Camellia lanceoleosa TaxID=1840588 RepID=A0ACC0GD02_9ERIC|nr:RNA-binding protein 48 [Camellia lanceoleosa]
MCFMSQRESSAIGHVSIQRRLTCSSSVYSLRRIKIFDREERSGIGMRCKPKDDEDCEPFTDVYWIKFSVVNNARFAKRKLDEFVFLGNRLQVSYAPHYESLSDTKDKLEGRRKEVLARLNPGRSKPSVVASPPETRSTSQLINSSQRDTGESQHISHSKDSSMTRVTSDKDYFPSQSMNQTVQLVREKLNKIQSNVEHFEAAPSKKTRVDNRRRI